MAEAPKAAMWKCHACYNANDKSDDKCVFCGVQKGYDLCSCGTLNPETTAICPECAMWKCHACHNANDKSNDECVYCLTKPCTGVIDESGLCLECGKRPSGRPAPADYQHTFAVAGWELVPASGSLPSSKIKGYVIKSKIKYVEKDGVTNKVAILGTDKDDQFRILVSSGPDYFEQSLSTKTYSWHHACVLYGSPMSMSESRFGPSMCLVKKDSTTSVSSKWNLTRYVRFWVPKNNQSICLYFVDETERYSIPFSAGKEGAASVHLFVDGSLRNFYFAVSTDGDKTGKITHGLKKDKVLHLLRKDFAKMTVRDIDDGEDSETRFVISGSKNWRALMSSGLESFEKIDEGSEVPYAFSMDPKRSLLLSFL